MKKLLVSLSIVVLTTLSGLAQNHKQFDPKNCAGKGTVYQYLEGDIPSGIANNWDKFVEINPQLANRLVEGKDMKVSIVLYDGEKLCVPNGVIIGENAPGSSTDTKIITRRSHPTLVLEKVPPAAALSQLVVTGFVTTRDYTASEIFWQKVNSINPVLVLLVVSLAGLTFTVMLRRNKRRKKGRIYIKAKRWRSWWFAGDGDEEKPDSELSGAQKIWKRTACFLGL